MTLILGSLAAIFALYFAFALGSPYLPKKVCAICAAVSLTWLGLLIGYFLNWHDNFLLLGIFMGGSVVGIMYKMEKYFAKKQLANFWLVRILIVVFGFLIVYLLITKQWNNLLTTGVVAVILGFLTLLAIKTPANQKTPALTEEQKTLKEKMEHCCD